MIPPEHSRNFNKSISFYWSECNINYLDETWPILDSLRQPPRPWFLFCKAPISLFFLLSCKYLVHVSNIMRSTSFNDQQLFQGTKTFHPKKIDHPYIQSPNLPCVPSSHWRVHSPFLRFVHFGDWNLAIQDLEAYVFLQNVITRNGAHVQTSVGRISIKSTPTDMGIWPIRTGFSGLGVGYDMLLEFLARVGI